MSKRSFIILLIVTILILLLVASFAPAQPSVMTSPLVIMSPIEPPRPTLPGDVTLVPAGYIPAVLLDCCPTPRPTP